MYQPAEVKGISWLGLGSVALLCIWFFLLKGSASLSALQSSIAWVSFAGAHILAIAAFRRDRLCWFYFLPPGFVWVLFFAAVLGVFR